MVVIKDVARLAGVSTGTVSKYFNHPEQLRPSTRQRVAKIVDELEYRPNPIARSMRTGKTQIVAVFVPEIANPFYAEGFSYLSTQMLALGYLPLLITTDNNPVLSDPQRLSILIAQTDAIILYLLDEKLNCLLLPSLQAQKPTLLVTQRDETISHHSIVIEEEKGMATMAKHLYDIGRRRIAFIGGPVNDSMTDSKYAGFLSALEDKSATLLTPIRCEGFSPNLAYAAAKSLIELDEAPDAICCANDNLAMGTLKCLHEHGFRVPQDIALTGYDNLSLSELTEPELTTVLLPLERVAVIAAEFLKSENDEFKSQRLETSLIVRGSTVQKTDYRKY